MERNGQDVIAPTEEVYQRFQAFFRNHDLPGPKQGPWLVAVSGGVDSMTLLALARQMAMARGISLAAVHVNHGLRADATLDEQLVRAVCQGYGVPLHAVKIDIAEIPASQRLGTEADARGLRYRALLDIARRIRATVILLGHHADDQTETVLWRLIRGTSLQGLGGIRPIRFEEGVCFVRPLLDVEKNHLKQFAAKYQIRFREDFTNQNIEYTRNFIRHELIPKIRSLQPRLGQSIARMSSQLQEDEEFLRSEAQKLLHTCTHKDDTHYKIDLNALASRPRPLQRRVIKIILYCLASEDWSFVHVESILDLCDNPRPSAMLSLPAGLVAARDYDWLWLGYDRPLSQELSQGLATEVNWLLADGVQLNWPTGRSSTSAIQWQFVCRAWTDAEGQKRGSPFELLLPRIPSVLVRQVRTSDRLALMGMTGTKKVQDIFTDAKVPKPLRFMWPGLYLDGHLVWLTGLRRSREFLIHHDQRVGWLISAVKQSDLSHQVHMDM